MEQLERSLSLKTQVIIHGNIYDRVPFEYESARSGRTVTYLLLRSFLRQFYSGKGYRIIGFYDLVDGLYFESPEEYALLGEISPTAARCGSRGDGKKNRIPARGEHLRDFDEAVKVAREALSNGSMPGVIIFDFASRLLTDPGHLRLNERSGFITLIKCALEASRVNIDGRTCNNQALLICDKLNDLPTWMYLNNPLVSSIHIDLPNEEERRSYFERNLESFHRAGEAREDRDTIISHFVSHTAGLRHHDMQSLQTLSHGQQLPATTVKEIRTLIDLFKFGVRENPWENIGSRRRERLQSARELLSKRVKGQEMAINAVVDVLKRAVMGLSGVQHSSRSYKPRGVLFFAGPTGVGKTELAKALAELLFEDEDACIRFDMSEYGTSHSDQKLMGAPPGYVGYQEGGQLTNKVKANPFSVLLFDEIEKADPSILDKFLQILEDGRMTDGRGETVYFSESIIIFTSNIGTYVRSNELGAPVREANIRPYCWVCTACEAGDHFFEKPDFCPNCRSSELKKVETPYIVVKRRILREIQNEFKVRLGRPELYNRFGNNFVVFDYIRPSVMRQIVGKNLERVTSDLADRKKITLVFDRDVVDRLVSQVSADTEMGARGVGNRIETAIVNPLARQLFDEDIPEGTTLHVKGVIEEECKGQTQYRLELEKQ